MLTDSPTDTSPPETRGRALWRLLFAVALSGALCALGATSFGRQLRGPVTIVGYPIYAAFDPNRYLVVYYSVSIAFPLGTLALYELATRVGPLRRERRRRRAPRGLPVPVLASPAPTETTRRGQLAGTALLGGLLGLELAIVFPPRQGTVWVWCLAAAALLALLGALISARPPVERARRRLGLFDLFCMGAGVLLLAAVSERTTATLSPGGSVVHYRFFPLWLAIGALVVCTLAVLGALRRGRSPERLARGFIAYLATPLLLFLLLAALPGPGGTMGTFSEGEYLGGSYLLLHGALPWRDLYLIHGLLSDGLKPLVGYALFGMSRWGATAGIDFLWAPAYWIATYLFTTLVFGRRWFAAAAAAGAVGLGILANWDVRYLFWPLLLALFAATLRRPSWRFGAALGFAALLQALLIPEMLYAALAVGVTLVAFELCGSPTLRPHWRDLPRTLGAAGAGLVGSVAFAIWLAVTGATSGFIGYFSDFASAHSLSGGIPLFTNYAIPGTRDALGVFHFNVTYPGLFTRYSLELVLPVVGILAAFALCCARVRSGRRLYLEDWVTICAALLTLLYYPKGLSRADAGHITEGFAVSVPLLICLTYRLVEALDDRLRQLLGGVRVARGALTMASPVGLLLLAVVLAVAPTSPAAAFDAAPAHFRISAAPAPPPALPGAGALGYQQDALPAGLVQDMAAMIATYAGPSRAVFDFTNAPGLFNFLLATAPASRFYDINLTITEGAQQQAVR